MWPMRLWNNFPGQPTSAWMWRYQHSTQPFNTVLLWPMRLQVTSWIIWFVLDISYIWIIWLQIFFRFVIFDYKFCLGWFDLTWFDKKYYLINLIWFNLTAKYILYYLIWFDWALFFRNKNLIWFDNITISTKNIWFDLIRL